MRRHVEELRAAAQLAVIATVGVVDVVEEMHCTIASGPRLFGRPLARPARVVTRLAYAPVRSVTRAVGYGLDGVLARIEAELGDASVSSSESGVSGVSGVSGSERDAAIAALNGVVGDYLASAGSALAIPMELRARGAVTDTLLVLVHGSSMNDRQWRRGGHDHGVALADALGATAVYVRYNSGRSVAANGAELATQLDALVTSWPVPVREITFVAHSMGGLVARTSCAASSAWRPKVRALVCLGTPHHGSPLEQTGYLVERLLGVSAYSAPLQRLARIRSAGVTDLRWGLRDVALPAGVTCFAIAGERDALVPIESALAGAGHRWVAKGASHLDLLSRPDVFERIRSWLSDEAPERAR